MDNTRTDRVFRSQVVHCANRGYLYVASVSWKKLIIVEQRLMLTFACRQRLRAAGATVLGSVRSTRRLLDALLEWDVDAAIVDVEIDDQTLLNVSIALESANVPFVFANRAKSNDRGYSVSGDSAELRK